MKIVTSGSRYIDIDAYAGCIAYANLLNLKGIEAIPVNTAKINESITPSLLQLKCKLEEYEKHDNDEFIIIDVTYKECFDDIVDKDKIIEVIDHHAGYEDYWKGKLGENAKIEFIGAVATLIVELYEKENLLGRMSKDIAYLLMAAILDNTLNFKAKVTTNRDIIAYKKLEIITNNKENFAEKYFLECQSSIEDNLKEAIENDTKIELSDYVLPPVFAQLTIWETDNILNNNKILYDTLNNFGTEWMMNLICLKEGKSYIIVSNEKIQKTLEELLDGKFENNLMKLDNVWLRKEIMKKAIK